MTTVTTDPPAHVLPPLTRNDYERSEEIVDHVQAALSLSRSGLMSRAQVHDKDHTLFIGEEALVCLIRHYHLRGDALVVERLSEALVRRITGPIKRWLWEVGFRSDDEDDAMSEAYQETIVRLFGGSPSRDDKERREGGILDLDSDKSDFAQVRFWIFLQGRTTDASRIIGVARGRRAKNIDINDLAGHAPNGDTESRGESPSENWDDLSPWKTLAQQHEEDALRRAVRGLSNSPVPLRDVMRLRHFDRWQIESGDAGVVTLSTHFERTPKTIRSWLRKAEKQLRDILQQS